MDKSSEIFRIKVLRFGLPKSAPVNLRIGTIPLKEGDSTSELNFLDRAFCENNLLQLSSEFGKVYVGETLHLVASIANTSNERIKSAEIRADLIIEKDPNASHQQTLNKDLKNLKTLFKDDIKPMDPMTFSLEFKVDQPFTYFIMFNIDYKQEIRLLNNEMNTQIRPFTQTKRFKFDARLPFNISNRIFKQIDKGRLFVEIKLENSTKSQLSLKNVDMIPTEGFEVAPFEKIQDESDVILNVSEAKKIIFCMKVVNSQTEKMLASSATSTGQSNSINVGQLYLKWFNVTAGAADLLSKPIAMSIMKSDIELEIKNPIEYLVKDKIYAFEMRLTNKTTLPLDLLLTFYEKEMIGLKIIGLSRYDMKVGAGEKAEFTMFVLPLLEGIQKFLGLRIFNRLTQKEIPFMPLKEIVVKRSLEATVSVEMVEESLI